MRDNIAVGTLGSVETNCIYVAQVDAACGKDADADRRASLTTA
eukprot:COSAG02_NODE_38302_length_430_cov_1.894260_1_plen_43_part_00